MQTAANIVDIHLVSTLTPEDEARIAEAISVAAQAVLDALSIAYTLRIETTDGLVFQHHNAPVAVDVLTQGSIART